MNVSCNSTDYRHSHEDHSYGPSTEHVPHIQSARDSLDRHEEDGESVKRDTNRGASESRNTLPAEIFVESPPVVAPTPIRPAIRQLPSAESAGRKTPIANSRVSSFSVPRVGTPTQARPFGSLMNGLNFSPRTPSSSWDFGASPRTQDYSTTPRVGGGGRGQEDEDHDGVSVAGTEFTDLSEVTSTGSLTSVD